MTMTPETSRAVEVLREMRPKLLCVYASHEEATAGGQALDLAIAALSAQQAGEAEPVAWMHKSDLAYLKANPDDVQAALGKDHGPMHVPLYTHPQPAQSPDKVRVLVAKWRALVAAHDGEFAFVDGVKLCLRELEAAIAGCQTEGRELPKYFVEYSECEKAAYMRGIAVGENIASRDPVFAALDSVVPGWREHGSDTASAAATVITELSARATSNGSKPFRWDDDEGEAPSAWRPK